MTWFLYLGTLSVPPLIPRNIHADAREKEYEKDGTGTMYLFRLDATSVVDATRVVRQRTDAWGLGFGALITEQQPTPYIDESTQRVAQGGVARYVNHSCEPNCYTKAGIVWRTGVWHVFL